MRMKKGLVYILLLFACISCEKSPIPVVPGGDSGEDVAEPGITMALDSLTAGEAHLSMSFNKAVKAGRYSFDFSRSSDNYAGKSYQDYISCTQADTQSFLNLGDSLDVSPGTKLSFIVKSDENDPGTTTLDFELRSDLDTLSSELSFIRPFEYSWDLYGINCLEEDRSRVSYEPSWADYVSDGYFPFEASQEDAFMIGMHVDQLHMPDVTRKSNFLSSLPFDVVAGDDFDVLNCTFLYYNTFVSKPLNAICRSISPKKTGKGVITVSKGPYRFEKPYVIYEPIAFEASTQGGNMSIMLQTVGVSSGTIKVDYSIELALRQTSGGAVMWSGVLYSDSVSLSLKSKGANLYKGVIDFADEERHAKQRIYETGAWEAELTFKFTVHSPFDDSVIIRGCNCVVRYDRYQNFVMYTRGGKIEEVKI